ncbi:MAG: cytochrome c oxidase subunit 2 [Leptospiraceae bacterium]|nr:MAG: cytochrome c oxidase subunit 2 [Leptospiraceae bacterium]
MSIYIPEKDWFHPPEGAERAWIGISLIWCIIMFIMMPYWHFKGKQNSTGEAYRVTPQAFVERVDKFVESYKVGEENGIPIVEPPPGNDIYLLGKMWQWYPILKLKKGQEYRLHISSADIQHGFSLLPVNMNFQIMPGYDHVLTITPTISGEHQIICNEFCGIGHHLMTGKIIVE